MGSKDLTQPFLLSLFYFWRSVQVLHIYPMNYFNSLTLFNLTSVLKPAIFPCTISRVLKNNLHSLSLQRYNLKDKVCMVIFMIQPLPVPASHCSAGLCSYQFSAFSRASSPSLNPCPLLAMFMAPKTSTLNVHLMCDLPYVRILSPEVTLSTAVLPSLFP